MVAILLVPQAIAYAYLAGMPPQYGLYAALAPVFLYALFGTSPHLAIGPVAISAILVLAGVSQLEEPFSPQYIELVILLGLLIGFFQFLLGLLKQGNLVNLLSYPVIAGFTSAASIIIISSQLKDILGIQTPQFESFSHTLKHLFQNISTVHMPTLSIGIASLFFIFTVRRINPKIPSRLILVIVGIAASYYFDLMSNGVSIIGFVPSGLPPIDMPNINLSNIVDLLPTIALVTIIGIVESVGIAKALENKNDFYEIETNQELMALGISKMGGSFFGALPSSASFSRSALLHQTKAKTNLASLITVIFVVIALLFLTPILYYLPKVILAAIIIYAVKNLFEYQLAKQIYKLHKFDFIVMMITFSLPLILNLEIGIALGFLASFFILNKSKNNVFKSIFKSISQNHKNEIYFTTSSLDTSKLVLKIEDSLNFANCFFFKDLIVKTIEQKEHISDIEIQFSNRSDIDTSSIKAINEVIKILTKKEIKYTITNTNKKLASRLAIANIG